MVEPHALARVDELSVQINRLHVNYLQSDESPQKIEQRTKLESCIRKYLCLIAHGRKFLFPETADILRRSVETRNNFSAYRASTAWNAITRYAENLIAQPWRKEFSVIKTFSGFYMHDIEENLANAERLLECMGYRSFDHTSLVLEHPIDLDAVISVSRDAIVAFVECQIMKEIWEGVYPQFECSWLDILNFRETHICTAESAIKGMAYQYHQNCYHQHQVLTGGIAHDPYGTAPRFHQSSCVYSQAVSPQMNVGYYGYPPYQPCAVPPQARYACVVNPQQVVGYSMSPLSYQQAKSPSQPLPLNGYHFPHSHHMFPASTHNGYVLPQPGNTLPSNYGCVVPTGQLIELDSSASVVPSSHLSRVSVPHVEELKSTEVRNGNTTISSERIGNLYFDPRESSTVGRSDNNKSMRPNTLEDLKPRRNGVHADHLTSPVGGDPEKLSMNKYSQRLNTKKSGAPAAAMQDGTGTWESWDYVYRNLESQGYSKDVGERGDILHSSATLNRRGSAGSGGSSPNLPYNSRTIRDGEVSATFDQLPHISHLGESIQSMRLNGEDCSNGKSIDTVDSRNVAREVRDGKNSMIKDKVGPKGSSGVNKTLKRDHKREIETITSSSSTLKKGQEITLNQRVDFWECVFCTYHNKTDLPVCEICGKSRQPGNEDKPLISGGRECPKCTLVNARSVVSCVACDESLKNSPTYI